MSGLKLSLVIITIPIVLLISSTETMAADSSSKMRNRTGKADTATTEARSQKGHPRNGTAAPQDAKICVYKDENGVVQKANSIKDVPFKLRRKAECKNLSEFGKLASPEDIEIKGSEQKTSVSTALGKMDVRIDRGAAKYFAQLPTKALIDAAQAVNRGLSKGGFPRDLRSSNFPWKVVFIDKNLPETQIPLNLISNCNPAWMTPPGNIYVIAQRVAGECNGQGRVGPKRFTDTQLAETLVHEMAHAIEHHLLKGKNPGSEEDMRKRAEGFATWFTGFASGYSAVIEDKVVSQKYKAEAAREIAQNSKDFKFEGTSGDYARASMYFKAIQNRKGPAGILSVYDLMANQDLDFFSAISEVTGWNRKEIEKEALKATTKS